MIFHKRFRGLRLGALIAAMVPIAAFAGGGTFQAVNLQVVGSGDFALGAGTLDRRSNQIHLRVTGTGFDATAVYSAWFIIFNNPDECADGPGKCAGSDLGNPKVKGGVRNAGGFISGADTTGYFTGTLRSGSVPSGLEAGFGNLKNGRKAEIHIVLQSHGAPAAGTVATEISYPTGTDQFFLVFPPTKESDHD